MDYNKLVTYLLKQSRLEQQPTGGERKRENPDLVPKKVEIRPKGGNPYTAVRWVTPGEDEKSKEQVQPEPEEEIPEVVDERDVFEDTPQSLEEFMEQASLIRDWINKESNKANYYEIEEKMQWYAKNSNDEDQNILIKSGVDTSGKEWEERGINKSILVETGVGQGILKPLKNEPGWARRQIEGSQCLREVAAYKLSVLFKEFNGLVPVTALSMGRLKYDDELGSIQDFIDNAKVYGQVKDDAYDKWNEERRGTYEPPKMNEILTNREQIGYAAIFDALILNFDRHSYNFMAKNGNVILIDNGLSFPQPNSGKHLKYNDIIEESEIYKEPLSKEATKLVESVLERKDEVYRSLIPYLEKEVIDEVIKRANRILLDGNYVSSDLV